MDLKDKILNDLKQAMKDKNAETLEVLRLIQSALKNKEIAMRPKTLTEEEQLDVVLKLSKQMKESIKEFEKAARDDLLQKEKKQLEILSAYLPQSLSEQEVLKLIDEVIAKKQASSMKQMGEVMKELTEVLKGRADNQFVSQQVRKKLS